MTSAAPEHITTSRELLAKAQESLDQDDLLQASEKGWGAAAHMVNGVAEKRGWPHSGHRELYQIVNRLTQEASDPQLRSLFSIASSLHANFYELWMPREMVEEDLRRVRELLARLEEL
ncbi:MAG: hypothetical protein BZY80_03440 [SAR202 cluster bacterium Io17-Chloro-G2]|nr:MAG: hypothetical protein BZY80_03440 [SAR202 cluster bacterium Io17-Chloro-G2]